MRVERPLPFSPSDALLPVPPANAETIRRADALIHQALVRPGAGTLFEEALAKAVLNEGLRSPVADVIVSRISPLQRDNFARALVRAVGPAALDDASLALRSAMLASMRKGHIGRGDRKTFNALADDYHDDLLAEQHAALLNPERRSALRSVLLRGGENGRALTFAGTSLTRLGEPSPKHPVVHFFYSRLVERNGESSPKAVAKALARPPVRHARTGRPVRLKGLTLYRPGLANVGPSASSLLRLAQHADKLVLMYPHADGTAASRLRRLTEYRGVKVPDPLHVYAIGRPERMLQSASIGSDVLIEQLEELRTTGRRLGIHFDPTGKRVPTTFVAHSQGNVEVALTRLRLAAAGFPDAVSRHIALSPALRGSLVSEQNALGRVMRAVGRAAAGKAGKSAIGDLAPEKVAALVPELMRKTVDLSFIGVTDAPKKPGYAYAAMRLTDPFADASLDGSGSDGLVDLRSANFVAEPGRFVVSDTAYDHMSMITDARAVDEWLSLVPTASDKTREELRLLAVHPSRPKSSSRNDAALPASRRGRLGRARRRCF